MLKIYFSEWGTGKLQRLPYIGYHILLVVIIIAIIFAGIFAVGATENLMGGDIVETQKILMDKFGIAAMLSIAVLMLISLFGQVNILGKRIRDMGLPVLWTILGIIAVSLVLNVVFPPEEVTLSAAAIQTADASATAVTATTSTTNMIVQFFNTIIFLCLVLIPSNTFGRKN